MQPAHVENGAAPLNSDGLDRDNRWPQLRLHITLVLRRRNAEEKKFRTLTSNHALQQVKISHLWLHHIPKEEGSAFQSSFEDEYARAEEGGLLERPAETSNGRSARPAVCVPWKFGSFHGRPARNAFVSKKSQLSQPGVRSVLFTVCYPCGGIRFT